MKPYLKIQRAFIVGLSLLIIGLSSVAVQAGDPCAGTDQADQRECRALQKMNESVKNTNTPANQERHKRMRGIMKGIK